MAGVIREGGTLAGLEIFTLWYKRARRVPGGLNLLLAFNGVCKLYSKKEAEARETLRKGQGLRGAARKGSSGGAERG